MTSAPSSAEFHLLTTINTIPLAEMNPALGPSKSLRQESKYRGIRLAPAYHQTIHSVTISDPFLSPAWLQTTE